MNISQEGVNIIKKFEGCVLHVYLDAVGVPTAGYGHTAGLSRSMVGQPITQALADNWLKEDLKKFEKKVNKYDAIYHWNQHELNSLVSFAYNIGSIDGLTANGTRSKQQIADAMLKYNKAGGKILNGLVKRRQAERELFLKRTVTIKPTLKRGNSGLAVKEMQGLLGIKQDGIFGTITETAVRLFQRQHGLIEDGICGVKTWNELLK
jgi:GH24 family phage-related lysozyme (muramidase)